MIKVSVQLEGVERAIRIMDRISRPDLRPLADSVVLRIFEGNERGLESQTDRFGIRMKDISPDTALDPDRGGDGPPLIPKNAFSRAISDLSITQNEITNSHIEIYAEWPDFIRYHRKEVGRRPMRDVVGIRPDDMKLIEDDVENFAIKYFEDDV